MVDPVHVVVLAHCPTQKEWAMTQACLEAVHSHSPQARVVLVDNGSPTGPADLPTPFDHLAILPTNVGFAGGMNAGLALVPSLVDAVLLNNDVLVQPGWLKKLGEAANAPWTKPELDSGWGMVPLKYQPFVGHPPGLVGPMGNNVSGVQGQESPATLSGARFSAERLVFFAVYLTAACRRAVGPLDQDFGLGSFEDDYYCQLALRAGFLPAVAPSVWLNHAGHATYRAMDPSMGQLRGLLDTNSRIYAEKIEKLGGLWDGL